VAVTIKVKKHFANLFFKAQTIIILKFSEKNVLMKLVHPGRYLHKNHKAAESGEKHFRAYKIFRAGIIPERARNRGSDPSSDWIQLTRGSQKFAKF